MATGAADPGELDEIVEFVTAQQQQPDRQISYVGTDAAGIRAELDGLEPPWTTTLRARRDGAGLSGVVVLEWDEELGRAWIVGPWVRGDGETWTTIASELVDDALAQLPASVSRCEMSGEAANQRLADLAARRGDTAGEANRVLVADAASAASWPDVEPAGSIRPATAADIPAIAPLHDAEFPDTYAPADRLLDDRIVLVAADGEGRITGYAAGQVHDDGEGFVDFVVVDPAARRAGVGRNLVVALGRQLLDRSSLGRVALTVQDHRRPARDLYARLGFRTDGILVGYRSWTAPDAETPETSETPEASEADG